MIEVIAGLMNLFYNFVYFINFTVLEIVIPLIHNGSLKPGKAIFLIEARRPSDLTNLKYLLGTIFI